MAERTPEGHFRSWVDRHLVGISIIGLSVLLVFVFLADRIFITIPAGHGGALWLRFFGGTVMNFHYGEGTKIIPPWDRIYVYDLRVQERSQQFDILTKEGLQVSGNATLRFRLNPEALGAITAFAGPDFVRTLVMPSVGATARLEAVKYTAEEVYSLRRREMEIAVLANLSQVIDDLVPNGTSDKPEILIEDFGLRSITLPPNLAIAIEAKLIARQSAEEYVHMLRREARESERKKVEAEGIRSFQDIVSSGISETYLQWKGIDATLKLAYSPNSKVVIVGGQDGLPLVLGSTESNPGAPAPAGQRPPRLGAPPPAAGPRLIAPAMDR